MKNILMILALVVLGSSGVAGASEKINYIRIGVNHSDSKSTEFGDYEDPNSSLPLLFGSPQYHAAGDFGGSTGLSLSLGRKISDRLSLELSYTHSNSFEFEGNANFVNSGNNQPSSTHLDSHLIMFNALYHFKPKSLSEKIKLSPYLGLGVGQSSNKIDPLVMEFPSFNTGSNGQLASSVTPAGDRKDFSYQAIAGLNFPLSQQWSLDLEYKYVDHGKVQTNEGELGVIRFNDEGAVAIDTLIDIQRTAADLKTHNLMLALKFEF